jgi:hypothetical protein
MKTDLEAARDQAVVSPTPYQSFHSATGYYPGQFPFKKVQEVITLRTADNWAEFVRLKEILLLQSLDLSHEPSEPINSKSSTTISGGSKSRTEKFKLEEL